MRENSNKTSMTMVSINAVGILKVPSDPSSPSCPPRNSKSYTLGSCVSHFLSGDRREKYRLQYLSLTSAQSSWCWLLALYEEVSYEEVSHFLSHCHQASHHGFSSHCPASSWSCVQYHLSFHSSRLRVWRRRKSRPWRVRWSPLSPPLSQMRVWRQPQIQVRIILFLNFDIKGMGNHQF